MENETNHDLKIDLRSGDEVDDDDLFGPEPTAPMASVEEFQVAWSIESSRNKIEDLYTSDTEIDQSLHGQQTTRESLTNQHEEMAITHGKPPENLKSLSEIDLVIHDSDSLADPTTKRLSCSCSPPSPPRSDTDEYDIRTMVSEQSSAPSSIHCWLPSPPVLKESSASSRQLHTSRQSSPADYEGPALRSDQLPIEEINQLQIEARAKKLVDTYRDNGELCKDPNLQSSLDYLAQLNSESQILWLNQQPNTIKQRAMHAVDAFKKDAEIRKAPNLEPELQHLATLEPARQLAYLQWPGAQPVARKALTDFEKEIRQKGWPLERFKELYLMSSEEQINYLYERMEFWPGFAKQNGLPSRPSNFDPKWEGRWPDSARIATQSRARSPTPMRDITSTLLNRSDIRSVSTYLVPPAQGPLHRPPSPKKDVINLPSSSPSSVEPVSTSRPLIAEAADDRHHKPPVASHLFTSSESALEGHDRSLSQVLDPGHEFLQNRSKTPLELQDRVQNVRKSLEPTSPSHPKHRESSPPYEDRSGAPSPSGSLDIQMEGTPPVPPLNPARTRPNQSEEQQKLPSSPDLIATSTPTVPSPHRSMNESRAIGQQTTGSGPRSQSRSRSCSPKKPQRTATKNIAIQDNLKPILPKKSDRRKSLGVAGSKVEKARKATQGNSSSVKDAVEKIEAGLKKEEVTSTAWTQNEKDIAPRRSQRIRLRKDRDSMSLSPGA